MTTPNSDEDVGKLDHSYIVSGNVKSYSYSNSLAVSLKTKYSTTIESSNCTPGCLSQRNETHGQTKAVHTCCSGFICNSPNLEMTQMSLSG